MDKELLFCRLRNLLCYALVAAVVFCSLPKNAYAYTPAAPLGSVKDISFADLRATSNYFVIDTRYKYRIEKQDFKDQIGAVKENNARYAFFVNTKTNRLADDRSVSGWDTELLGEDDPDNDGYLIFDFTNFRVVTSFLCVTINDYLANENDRYVRNYDWEIHAYVYGLIATNAGDLNGKDFRNSNLPFTLDDEMDGCLYEVSNSNYDFTNDPINIKMGLSIGDALEPFNAVSFNNFYNGSAYSYYENSFSSDVTDDELLKYHISVSDDVNRFLPYVKTRPESYHGLHIYKISVRDADTGEDVTDSCNFLVKRHFSRVGYTDREESLHLILFDDTYNSYTLKDVKYYCIPSRDSPIPRTSLQYVAMVFEVPHKEAHTHTTATREANRVEPTCTTAGSVDVTTYCSDCGEVLSTTTRVLQPLGHDMTAWSQTTNPTCERDGEESRHCQRCDYTETRSVSRLEHTPATREDNRVEPTCTAPGSYDLVTYCTECDQLFSTEHLTIPALGHDMEEWTVTRQPTCDREGTRERHCTRCDYSESSSIEKTDHTVSIKSGNRTEPTCTHEGHYDVIVYCPDCNLEITRERQNVPALGHDFSEWSMTTDPTCERDGVATRTCTRCDYAETKSISKLEHTTATREDNRVEPTCTTPGSYDLVTYCTVCNKVFSTEHLTIPALGHDFTTWAVTKQPTCGDEGTRERRCTRCDYSEHEGIEKSNHVISLKSANRVEPTCTADGHYDLIVYCDDCDQEITRERQNIPALGHDLTDWAVKTAPTYTTKGVNERHCKRCDFKETSEIPMLVKTATVDGRVLNSNGYPLANKIVELHSDPQRTKTDSNGYYKFESVPTGEHVLTVYDDTAATRVLCKVKLNIKVDKSETTIGSKDTNFNVSSTVHGSDVTTNVTGIQVPTSTPITPTAKYYTVTVIDKYGDTAVVRAKDTLVEGVKYSYSAVPKDGYVLNGTNVQTGVVTADTTITFYYTAIETDDDTRDPTEEPDDSENDDWYPDEPDDSGDDWDYTEDDTDEVPVDDDSSTPTPAPVTTPAPRPSTTSSSPKTGEQYRKLLVVPPLLVAAISFCVWKSKQFEKEQEEPED